MFHLPESQKLQQIVGNVYRVLKKVIFASFNDLRSMRWICTISVINSQCMSFHFITIHTNQQFGVLCYNFLEEIVRIDSFELFS